MMTDISIERACESMTNRERIDAVLRGKDIDRFPVWLKMTNPTWRTPQPEPYRSMDSTALLRAIGCDVMGGCGVPANAVTTKRPHVTEAWSTDGLVTTTTIETPDGPISGQDVLDPHTRSSHPTAFCAATLDDLKKLRWFYTDTEYSVDTALAEAGHAARKTLEDDDVYTMAWVGPAPFMHLLEHQCGPQACVYHLFDAPDLFAETLEIMHQDRLRYLRAILPHCPADTFWFGENTSTSLISPTMFKEYCMPHLSAYGAMVLEQDIIPVHHMCGLLNDLLEMIDELPAMANEAFTTPPLGNTTLTAGRTRMPSKALLGGTNATLWLQPAKTIIRTVAEDLATCPDRRKIFLTSAGVLPAQVSFEKARSVVAALKRL